MRTNSDMKNVASHHPLLIGQSFDRNSVNLSPLCVFHLIASYLFRERSARLDKNISRSVFHGQSLLTLTSDPVNMILNKYIQI